MKSSIDSYFKDVGRHNLLSREEEVSLSKRIEKGDQKARDIMIKSNLRLAISIAKKYHRSGCDLEDLIQESNIGLMKAVDRFDWRRGFKFSTYACWWIKQSVFRHISSNRSTVRIPTHASSLAWKIKNLITEYEEEFDQKPKTSEIAEILGVSESMVKTSIDSMKLQYTISIDARIGGEETGRTIGEMIEDENSKPPDEIIDDDRVFSLIKACMNNLSPREEQILRLRFGITDTFSHVKDFDISDSEIEKIKQETE